MKELRCIIIDDEMLAHAVLKDHISQSRNLVFVASFYDAISAIEFLSSNDVDLIFLDINIPEIDGFKFLELKRHRSMVIITSAFSKYALKSYDYEVVDYLLKPVSYDRFQQSVKRVVENFATWKLKNDSPRGLLIKHENKEMSIDLDDIVYVESMENYIRIITANNCYTVHSTTKAIENRLPKNIFVRIHRSFIINLKKVDKIDDNSLILNNQELPIGRTFKKYLIEQLREL